MSKGIGAWIFSILRRFLAKRGPPSFEGEWLPFFNLIFTLSNCYFTLNEYSLWYTLSRGKSAADYIVVINFKNKNVNLSFFNFFHLKTLFCIYKKFCVCKYFYYYVHFYTLSKLCQGEWHKETCWNFSHASGHLFLQSYNRNTRTRCEIWSKLTLKTHFQWRRSGVFIVIFERISHLVLVFLLLTLSR